MRRSDNKMCRIRMRSSATSNQQKEHMHNLYEVADPEFFDRGGGHQT